MTSSQSQIENRKSKIGLNPWPLALTLIITGAFAFAAFIAVTMIRKKVDLVPAGHYERDLRHNERMAREQRARSLGQPVKIALTADRNISVQFPDASATGHIRLYRPSDSSLDVIIEIAPDATGLQLIPAATLAAGLWEAQIEWTQNGEEYALNGRIVLP